MVRSWDCMSVSGDMTGQFSTTAPLMSILAGSANIPTEPWRIVCSSEVFASYW